MNDLKYIIIQPIGYTREGARAIIFNGLITHVDACPKFAGKVLSAGFFTLKLHKKRNLMVVSCWGKSTSMKVDSNPTFDQKVIAKTLARKHEIDGSTLDVG